MIVSNTIELSALIIDWLNREDIEPAVDGFIKAADERILSDSRARGEITEEYIVKNREERNKINPVPIQTRWYDEWEGFYEDGLDPAVDEQPSEQSLDENTYNIEFLSVFLDGKKLHRVTVNEFFNESNKADYQTYTEMSGRLYIKGWKAEEDVEPGDLAPYKLELYVHKKQPIDFSAEAPTSDMLKTIPTAYLYASLVEASIYLRDMEGMQIYQARYEELMEKMYKDYKRSQASSGWSVKSVGGDKLFSTRRV